MSLRGPVPLTADPHVSTGSTPGVGIIKVTESGRDGIFEAVARVSNFDGTIERAPGRLNDGHLHPAGIGDMDQALNLGFFIFHTAWIAFNCLGWIWKRTRPWHLATVSTLSWFGLGIVFGWGYCPCTDWHWQVRARLGFDDPPSYIQLLARALTGIELRQPVADTIAVVTLASATLLGVALTIRERRRSALGGS